jgi:hypothetical protein
MYTQLLLLITFMHTLVHAMEYMPGTGTFISHPKTPVKVTTTSKITGIRYPEGMEQPIIKQSGNTVVIQAPAPHPTQSVCVVNPPAPVIIASSPPSQSVAYPDPLVLSATPPAHTYPSKVPSCPDPLYFTQGAYPQMDSPSSAPAGSVDSLFSTLTVVPNFCMEFIRSHPYITAGISVVALSYSYLLYRCWYIKRYLEQTNTWSGWNIQVPLEVLKSKVQEEVADILMADIKAHYQITAGAYDLMRALLIFKGEVDTELKKLNTYKALIEYLDGSYIQAVLPDLRPLKIGLTERIQRILYLKDILYTWLHTNNRSLRASHELL